MSALIFIGTALTNALPPGERIGIYNGIDTREGA